MYHEGSAPDFSNFDKDKIDEEFRKIDEVEHLAEPEGGEPEPRPKTPIDNGDKSEIEWGVPGAEHGDGVV